VRLIAWRALRRLVVPFCSLRFCGIGPGQSPPAEGRCECCQRISALRLGVARTCRNRARRLWRAFVTT